MEVAHQTKKPFHLNKGSLSGAAFTGCLAAFCIWRGAVATDHILADQRLGEISPLRSKDLPLAKINSTQALSKKWLSAPETPSPQEVLNALTPTFELIKRIAPTAHQELEALHQNQRIHFDLALGNRRYAFIDVRTGTLSIGPGILGLSDGEKAMVLLHELRHHSSGVASLISSFEPAKLPARMVTAWVQNEKATVQSMLSNLPRFSPKGEEEYQQIVGAHSNTFEFHLIPNQELEALFKREENTPLGQRRAELERRFNELNNLLEKGWVARAEYELTRTERVAVEVEKSAGAALFNGDSRSLSERHDEKLTDDRPVIVQSLDYHSDAWGAVCFGPGIAARIRRRIIRQKQLRQSAPS